MAVERIVDGASEVVLDDRLAPILIATWWGAASQRTIDGFHVWIDRQIEVARASGTKLALINDSTDAERPSPDARRKFIEKPHDGDVLIALPTVVTNPLVRGALTAVGWVMGERMKPITSHASMIEAFEQARTALREAGVRPPPSSRLDAYARPSRAVGA